jgi:hypothetical protein
MRAIDVASTIYPLYINGHLPPLYKWAYTPPI